MADASSRARVQSTKYADSRLTDSGKASQVAISPDGRYIVYVLVSGERQSLRVRNVATKTGVEVIPARHTGIWGRRVLSRRQLYLFRALGP